MNKKNLYKINYDKLDIQEKQNILNEIADLDDKISEYESELEELKTA